MGLNLWFDSTDILNDGSDPIEGVTLSTWRDKSTYGRDMDNSNGDPTLKFEGYQGKPVVDFDGNDQLWTTHSFSSNQMIRNMGYVAFGVSRYTGGVNNRVISSVGYNWLMGHHGNRISRYYLSGWVYRGYAADTNFHLWEIAHEGRNHHNDPMGTVWTDGVQVAQNRSSAWWGFYPSQLSFGASGTLAEASRAQVAEFIMVRGGIEESERLLIEGYLAHKWGIALPGEHPWAFEQPTFGEITSGDSNSTPIGFTGQTLAPIVVNRNPANQTDTSAKLTGKLVNAGLGLIEDSPFTPADFSGLRLWLDASDTDGDGEDGSDDIFGAPLALIKDKSGIGNDATQEINASQPIFVGNGLNEKPVIQFDGSDDFINFNEINTIRTAFLVIQKNSGNNGFLLGHEDSYSFHPGNGTAWSEFWTDTFLLNGILHANGNLLDGLSQDYPSSLPTIISIRTTGMLPASNFFKRQKQ